MNKKGKIRVNRFTLLVLILLLIYGAIISKLVMIQIVDHEDYKGRADELSVKSITEQAPRGKIYDSNGAVLADSKQSYAVEYMETEESKKLFFDTMATVFKLLDKYGEEILDEFRLKIDESGNFYMNYNTQDATAIKTLELRFKEDRNFDYYIKNENKYFKDKKEDDYTEEDLIKLEDLMLEISPEEMFYRLVKQYKMYLLLNPTEDEAEKYSELDGEEITELLLERYSLQDIRKYMVVLDAIKMQSYSGYNPTTIASNISNETAFVFMQKLNDMPGIDVRYQPVRYYPYGSLASSVIGYVSSISSTQKEKLEEKGYDAATDKLGISGIEAAFEEELKGAKGENKVKVNTYGRITEELFRLETFPGNNVHLTLDSPLQYTAERSLKEALQELSAKRVVDNGRNIVANANRGAVVVTEVNTGRILAMASYPDFDPNIFTIPGMLTDELSEKYFTPDYEAFAEEYIKATGSTKTPNQLFSSDYTVDTYDIYPKPFFNYATQGLLPTGSTFKFVTAAAALEAGVVNPYEKIYDHGIFNKYDEFENYQGMCEIYNSYRGSHGYVNMAEAFRVSCNYYFYELAYRLYDPDNKNNNNENFDALAEFSWKLGLGYDPETDNVKGTGVEIYENKNGQVYSISAYANLAADMAKFDVVDMLEAGEYTYAPGMGENHEPFLVAYKANDDQELAEAKQAVKDYVADGLRSRADEEKRKNAEENDNSDEENGKSDKVVINDIQKLLKRLVSHYSEEERAKFTDDDFIKAANNLYRYIYIDRNGDITAPGNMTNSSIGLGMNQFTPLQVTNALATIVNGGTRYQAHLVDRVTSPDNEVVKEYEPTVVKDLELKESTVKNVKYGMSLLHKTGVFGNFPIPSAGKTGTAIFRNDQREIGRSDYGVYVAFAPIEKPEIAITVVMYDAAHGSSAAPVARAVMETYFRDIIKTQHPGYTSTTTAYTLEPPVAPIYNDGETAEN
ncbi:penicillin-binding transpeptidase domain-containing protein [Alloiococcus sp. CFN-8]|uniref:penicillin-binding transpeptidase domain-containing protein n=1 Tax=Alloiococcus sp. CFN-8 TaxID=3416081 RepID=UPI003CFA875C